MSKREKILIGIIVIIVLVSVIAIRYCYCQNEKHEALENANFLGTYSLKEGADATYLFITADSEDFSFGKFDGYDKVIALGEYEEVADNIVEISTEGKHLGYIVFTKGKYFLMEKNQKVKEIKKIDDVATIPPALTE